MCGVATAIVVPSATGVRATASASSEIARAVVHAPAAGEDADHVQSLGRGAPYAGVAGEKTVIGGKTAERRGTRASAWADRAAVDKAALTFRLLSGDADDEDTTPADRPTDAGTSRPRRPASAPKPDRRQEISAARTACPRAASSGSRSARATGSARGRTSSASDEIHLHGYDITKDVEAGKPATLPLQGRHRGRLRDREPHRRGRRASSR